METQSVSRRLRPLLEASLNTEQLNWLDDRMARILDPPSGRELYLAYSLIGRKLPDTPAEIPDSTAVSVDSAVDQLSGNDQQSDDPAVAAEATGTYLRDHGIRLGELGRIYLLATSLEASPSYFVPKIATLIQVADTAELATFLRYLPVLPGCAAFLDTAVDALRTNIATVFDAISRNNPYPTEYFNDQQWNQMYLKAAFMGRDLLGIPGIARRANADLARIISDYAHERWAAGREVDPLFWQPVGAFLDGALLADMERLLASPQVREQQAAYLCCRAASGNAAAEALVASHPIKNTYRESPFDWDDLKS